MNGHDNLKEIKTLSFIEINDNEFKLLRDLVYSRIGINLTEEKRNLLMGRLQKLLRQLNLKTFKEYYDYVISEKSGEAISELANHISTNHTFFYREHDHFEFFKSRTLPEIENKKYLENSQDIRIWCAGCSSGEEPYMLVMLMMEYFGVKYKNFKAGILATDISEKALNIARKGIYSNDRLKNLPELYRKKYFRKINNEEMEVTDEVRNEVTYRRFNLMNEKFPFKKKFDTIFCRNVMIYFDNVTREALVNRFYHVTENDGYLFIGHSESLKREKTLYKYIMPALYKKLGAC